jgi:hypothetical protein
MNYLAKFNVADCTGAIKEVVLETSTDKVNIFCCIATKMQVKIMTLVEIIDPLKLRRG